ncbi:MAG: ribosomal L7Ae/L30e/S12e/Gadd45 family protein [Bacilli bacterium]|jgi:ribosomal protein L7Ae-like RNA K-turn-binding protein|nr:ribosomal L7Ae/L30e/S12e/Gadd45 family protein [Bacilli bacterium]
MNNLLSVIGLAMKANKLVFGEKVILSIQKKQAQLVIISIDASDNTKKRLIDKCNYYGIDYLEMLSMEDIFKATGKVNRLYFSIIDSNFKKLIINKLR